MIPVVQYKFPDIYPYARTIRLLVTSRPIRRLANSRPIRLLANSRTIRLVESSRTIRRAPRTIRPLAACRTIRLIESSRTIRLLEASRTSRLSWGGARHFKLICLPFMRSEHQLDYRLPGPSTAPPSKRQSPWATLVIPPATRAISRTFVTTPGNLFFYSLFNGGPVSHATLPPPSTIVLPTRSAETQPTGHPETHQANST